MPDDGPSRSRLPVVGCTCDCLRSRSVVDAPWHGKTRSLAFFIDPYEYGLTRTDQVTQGAADVAGEASGGVEAHVLRNPLPVK